MAHGRQEAGLGPVGVLGRSHRVPQAGVGAAQALLGALEFLDRLNDHHPQDRPLAGHPGHGLLEPVGLAGFADRIGARVFFSPRLQDRLIAQQDRPPMAARNVGEQLRQVRSHRVGGRLAERGRAAPPGLVGGADEAVLVYHRQASWDGVDDGRQKFGVRNAGIEESIAGSGGLNRHARAQHARTSQEIARHRPPPPRRERRSVSQVQVAPRPRSSNQRRYIAFASKASSSVPGAQTVTARRTDPKNGLQWRRRSGVHSDSCGSAHAEAQRSLIFPIIFLRRNSHVDHR